MNSRQLKINKMNFPTMEELPALRYKWTSFLPDVTRASRTHEFIWLRHQAEWKFWWGWWYERSLWVDKDEGNGKRIVEAQYMTMLGVLQPCYNTKFVSKIYDDTTTEGCWALMCITMNFMLNTIDGCEKQTSRHIYFWRQEFRRVWIERVAEVYVMY